MSFAAIPEEISRHLEAVLLLLKRDVLLRVIQQADLCLEQGQVTAGAVLAGVALEEASLVAGSDFLQKPEIDLTTWRQVRDRATRGSQGQAELSAAEVRSMLLGLRTLLAQIGNPKERSTSMQSVEDALKRTRGKYAFVETSVDAFLKRKHADLDLEK
jgi:hypothetical protein